jgi:hypothetical protein
MRSMCIGMGGRRNASARQLNSARIPGRAGIGGATFSSLMAWVNVSDARTAASLAEVTGKVRLLVVVHNSLIS